MRFFNFKKSTIIILIILAILSTLYFFMPHVTCVTEAGGTCKQPLITRIFLVISYIALLPIFIINFPSFIQYPWYIPLVIIITVIYFYVFACFINWIIVLLREEN